MNFFHQAEEAYFRLLRGLTDKAATASVLGHLRNVELARTAENREQVEIHRCYDEFLRLVQGHHRAAPPYRRRGV